jgi:16S rRNA G966 N2-methylase RsmD
MNKYGYRVDIKKEVKPDLLCDAHKLSSILKLKFDIILADPPYSTEESKELYGTGPLNYMK